MLKYNLANFKSSFLLSIIIFALIIIGLVYVAGSQSVVTLTSTTTITLPPTTMTTTVEMPGGVQTVTVVMPGFKIIQYYEEPDVVCVVIFRMIKMEEPQVVTFGGTTVTIPGTTFSTVISESAWAISTVETRPGYTTTYTGYGGEIPVKMVVGDMTMTFTMPAYGEFREACRGVTVKNILSFILDKAPATFLYAFPGTTISIPEYVYTMPVMPMEAEPITTTYTTTKMGTTYLTTTSMPGTTLISTFSMPGTTYVSTIVKPGGTMISFIYYTTTIPGTTSTPATTVTRTETPTGTTTPTTRTTTTPVTTQTTTPTAQPTADWTLYLVLGLVVVVVIAGVAVLALRRKR
ncbi:MAG: hypothetical protein QXZ17_01120 [Nitrososphaerota archaeon]